MAGLSLFFRFSASKVSLLSFLPSSRPSHSRSIYLYGWSFSFLSLFSVKGILAIFLAILSPFSFQVYIFVWLVFLFSFAFQRQRYPCYLSCHPLALLIPGLYICMAGLSLFFRFSASKVSLLS